MRTALYRHFGSDGALLYVGVSLSVIRRLIQHKRSMWFTQITKITIEYFPSFEEALKAEQVAIQSERPEYNRTFKAGAKPSRTLWDRGQGEILIPITKEQARLLVKRAAATGLKRSSMLRIIIGEWLQMIDSKPVEEWEADHVPDMPEEPDEGEIPEEMLEEVE